MPLIKRRETTEKQLAANRRNQQLCNEVLTDAGRERIRAAHLRHGFYARDVEVSMCALGEDPAQLQSLTEGLWDTYNPTDVAQEGLVIRLARATWLMNRADRMQEGCAVRQATEISRGRQERLHARMMRLAMTADSLRLLARSVECKHYVTPRPDLEKIKSLHEEGVLGDMSEIILAFFFELQAPGTGEDGEDPEEKTRRVMNKIRGIFGLNPVQQEDEDPEAPAPELPEGADAQYPGVTPAEWEARERPRHLLENLLKRQIEVCEGERKVILKESLNGPSPFERAAEIAPTHPNTKLMRRMQDSNFREVRRITNLLLKLKRNQHKMEAWEGESDVEGV